MGGVTWTEKTTLPPAYGRGGIRERVRSLDLGRVEPGTGAE
jgi:hypothetical protein